MKTATRVLALLLNITLLIWAVGVTVQERMNGAGDVALAGLFMVTPVVSLAALAASTRTVVDASGWLSLWLQRKTAEERKRLKELQSDT